MTPDAPTPRPAPRRTPARPRLRRVAQLALGLAALVLVVESLAGSRGLPALLQARREHAALELDLQRLRAENARLRHEARRLREDPAAIEEIARRELGLISPGERVFIIRDVASQPDRR